jgi:gluconokinase
MLALALDAGSSSVRAALYDRDGALVPSSLAQVDIDLTVAPGGVVEIGAAEMRVAIEQVIDATLSHPRAAPGAIAVVGMTTFWHSLVVLDGADQPLTPVLTWADTRSEPEADWLRATLDGAAVHNRTGCILHPSYLPAKIRWVQRHQPDVAARAAAWLSFPQYCTGVWLGSTVSSVSMASGSGLFDSRAGDWDAELLATLGISRSTLGGFLPDPELLSPVTGAYAARWPALRGVPWRAPIGDGAASNAGVGCVVPEHLTLMVGTSGAMRRCAPADDSTHALQPGVWRYLLDRRHVLTGGALSSGGNLYAWLRQTLQLEDDHVIETQLARRQPGEHGLVVLPLLAGERSLGWVGDATGAIAGLTLHTSPLDILHASLEAVTYSFADLFDALKRGGESVVATGGGLQASPTWLHMMADALGCEVVVPAVREASLRGAAVIALRDVGLLEEPALADVVVVQRYAPREARYELHRERRALQRELYDREVGPGGANLLVRQSRS